MESKTVLAVTCALCGKSLGTKDGKGVSGVSHGLCVACYDKLMAAMDIAESMRSYWISQADGAER